MQKEKTPQRPQSIPPEAEYDTQDKTWFINHYIENSQIPTGNWYYWDNDGKLTSEFNYLGDGDTYIYKCYTLKGEIWNEGKHEEGIQTEMILYRYPHSEEIFKNNFELPDNAVKMVGIKFAPNDGYILEYKIYDIEENLIDHITRKEQNEHNHLSYDIARVNSALKIENYSAAKVRLEKLFTDESIPAHQLINACIDIILSCDMMNDFVKEAINTHIEKLYYKGGYDEALTLIESINENRKIGSEFLKYFQEWSMVLYIKAGKYTLSFQNNFFIRRFIQLERKGVRTSISDFIADMPEMQAYMQFLKNIPRYSSYKKVENKYSIDYQLIFDGDVLWDGDFMTDNLKTYYPELDHISTIIINGDFIVKGKIITQYEYATFKIKGNVETESLSQFLSGFEVSGDLKARRFIYLYNIDTEDGKKFSVKKMIDTPLFIIIGWLRLKHTGGFSENCIHIADDSLSHKYIKVYPNNSIRDYFMTKKDYTGKIMDFDALLKAFEAGEPIFKEEYDSTETVRKRDEDSIQSTSTTNNGDAEYYIQKAELLWKSGNRADALFPTNIATQHYEAKALDEITASKEYSLYLADCQSNKFILPKGYKNKYDKSIDQLPFADLVDQGAVLVYKGDVFWNDNLIAAGEIPQIPEKVFCNDIVILGDLYIKGNLFLHQMNLFVTGNLFVERYSQGDSIVQIMGNVFCKNDFRVVGDIAGAEITVYGNLSAAVLAVHATKFEVFGNIDPNTLLISLKGYEFTNDYPQKIYIPEDLTVDQEDFFCDDDLNLTEKLKNGTLFK